LICSNRTLLINKKSLKKVFLPTTRKEIKELGWDRPDIILVTGDSYIDSPFVGVALIGRLLEAEGFRVGIIAQPDLESDKDIGRLGQPRLFWGVTGGCIDSMVANYTALRKRRKSDDYTPGGINDRRPDRAAIVYSNLIRRYFKKSAPIVLGGLEASLRRVAHYDFWSNRIRKSILFDAKADYLLYGMADRSTIALAHALEKREDPHSIRGLCYISKEPEENYLRLPSFQEVSSDRVAFVGMFKTFYDNNDPVSGKGLCQQQDARYLIHNPPAEYLSQEELDWLYTLPFTRDQHPHYEKQGKVKALETIRFSLAGHRGCYGECNFCAITVHDGKTVRWRSPDSILSEARELTRHPAFKGNIYDVGGPTANMYGFECERKLKHGACKNKRCLFPKICERLPIDHGPQIDLLKHLRRLKGVKRVFVASGLRYDMIVHDKKNGSRYVHELVEHHVSGQLKIAPEHVEGRILKLMGKPAGDYLESFRAMFEQATRAAGKEQFLTYYFIAAHPGCTDEDMLILKKYIGSHLKINPEQVQIFTPLPSTWSAVMYYTEMDPFTGKKLAVQKHPDGKQRQKDILQKKPHRSRPRR